MKNEEHQHRDADEATGTAQTQDTTGNRKASKALGENEEEAQQKEEELTVTMSRILSRLWTLSPGNTSFTTGSVPS